MLVDLELVLRHDLVLLRLLPLLDIFGQVGRALCPAEGLELLPEQWPLVLLLKRHLLLFTKRSDFTQKFEFVCLYREQLAFLVLFE